MFFHITLTQGKRADTFYAEFTSETKAKTFFQTVSTASITSIKKVVYSKKYDINYHDTNHIETKYNDELIATIQSKDYTDIFKMKFPRIDLTQKQIIKHIKKNITIKGQPVINVVNLLVVANEGFSPTLSNS
jgi:hypothetical protein